MDENGRITKFADILLPVPIPGLFTYRIPASMDQQLKPLLRVIVPFGPKKIITGLVITIHEKPPATHEAKLVIDVLDSIPLFTERQITLFNWVASYYMSTEGDVLNAAMPAGLKLSSETLIQINPNFNFEESKFEFSEKEWMILNRIKNDTLSYTELAKFLNVKSLHSIIKSLRLKEAIVLIEEIKEKYQPKREKRIRFTRKFLTKRKLENLFEEISSKPKQEALLLCILQGLPVVQYPELNSVGISKSSLLSKGDFASPLKTLIKNSVLEEFEITIPRFPEIKSDQTTTPVLSQNQKIAREQILQFFNENKPTLLFGITGSGKTEIYISLIKDVLDAGYQALFLLPEIALTTQMVNRLQKVFGSALGIYHSRFSDNERVEVWDGVASGKIRLVLGVRSSIFLPFEDLGLIIVDEEHDGSYKQDRTPRYHARDTAQMLARFHGSKILLGSGTPSAESWYQAKKGNYGLVELKQRYGKAQPPQIQTIDLKLEKKLKRLKGSFSTTMLQAIGESIQEKDQVILFQNRRGYAPCIECDDCGYIPSCTNCSVSLTYHQYRNALLCHYCGYRENVPNSCSSCGGKALLSPGPGTEKIEEEIRLQFPEVTVQRMDLDTTRSKHGFENILNDFEKGKTQILVGTQMVSKGLDFDGVGLVGVFDADRLMHFPDFRSHERAFQTITQVSGRSGRREKQGVVLIQTYNPDNRFFQQLKNHQVAEFLEDQLLDRKKTFFPPFSRLIEISFRHVDKKICLDSARAYAEQIKHALNPVNILGPAEPSISKIKNEYIQTLLLKIPRDSDKIGIIKQKLLRIAEVLVSDPKLKRLRVIFDVDPM